MPDNKFVKQLKNALLALFLFKVNKKDFDKSFDYSKYNGNKLPPMSGNSIENALFSYIIDIDDFRQSAFYSKTSENKLEAINKYINKKLNSEKKILKLFNIFIKNHISFNKT
jgi:hypothetical protein